VAGVTPHPTENPKGHSYGQRLQPKERINPQRWYDNETYLYGIDLYNYAYWWEAHEAWESLWKGVKTEFVLDHFFQGLIKISAAFLKWHQMQPRGLRYLCRDGMSHLRAIVDGDPLCLGLRLSIHINKLKNHFSWVEQEPLSWPDPLKGYPFIVLEKPKRQ
jgi:hypothetical protein